MRACACLFWGLFEELAREGFPRRDADLEDDTKSAFSRSLTF